MILSEEAVDYLLLRLGLGQAERHELYDLVAGDLAYGGLVDERGVYVVRLQLRHCEHLCRVHDYRVALCMAGAGRVADNARAVVLIAPLPRHGA